MKHMILSVAALSVFALPLAASAAEDKTPKVAPVTVATDKNGNVTLAAARGFAEKQFGLFDVNKDGNFDMKEYRVPFDKLAQARKSPSKNKSAGEKAITDSFTRMDNNKDNKISKEEYLSDAELRHKVFDANHDGVVTPKELEEIQKKIASAHKKATK